MVALIAVLIGERQSLRRLPRLGWLIHDGELANPAAPAKALAHRYGSFPARAINSNMLFFLDA
jgi:hypothetical protein